MKVPRITIFGRFGLCGFEGKGRQGHRQKKQLNYYHGISVEYAGKNAPQKNRLIKEILEMRYFHYRSGAAERRKLTSRLEYSTDSPLLLKKSPYHPH